MTALATHQLEDPAQLALIADDLTPLRKPFADAFREACRAEAEHHDGWVDLSRVRQRLIAEFGEDGYNPRQLSALWSTACARGGYMVKTDRPVRITGEGSRGNGGKSVFLRRWVA